MMNAKHSRYRGGLGVVWCLAALALAGCANVRPDRASIEKLREVRVVQVATPALEAPTFMQAAVKRGVLGGAVPAAIAESDAKVTLTPPFIADAGALVARGL